MKDATSIWAVEVVYPDGRSEFAVFGPNHAAARRHADASRGRGTRVFVWDLMGS